MNIAPQQKSEFRLNREKKQSAMLNRLLFEQCLDLEKNYSLTMTFDKVKQFRFGLYTLLGKGEEFLN